MTVKSGQKILYCDEKTIIFATKKKKIEEGKEEEVMKKKNYKNNL